MISRPASGILLPLVCAATLSLLLSCGVNTRAISSGSGGTTVPPATEHLAVADTDNGRVLIFNSPFTTGESASVVIGQADFASDVMLNPESTTKLQQPVGLATDASGNLYVADVNGGRIMQFAPPFTNAMAATLELGVPDFNWPGDVNATNCDSGPLMGLCMPFGVTLDNAGDVWVADTWDGRVVEYKPPIQRAMNANVAIGQPTIDTVAACDGSSPIFRDGTAASNINGSEFCEPTATALDSRGDLWVADFGNQRILEFAPPFSTGMGASLELGYPTAIGMNATLPGSTCPPASATNLCAVWALTFDSSGDLWVADTGNNRVLEFKPPFSNGMSASLVIGQPDFTHNGTVPTASNTMYYPDGIIFDPAGNLIVSDSANSRVVIFVPPFSNGMNASIVLGQPDMTTGTGHGCGGWSADPPQFGEPSASTLCQPSGVLIF